MPLKRWQYNVSGDGGSVVGGLPHLGEARMQLRWQVMGGTGELPGACILATTYSKLCPCPFEQLLVPLKNSLSTRVGERWTWL